MILRVALTAFVALFLAACEESAPAYDTESDTSPLLYEVSIGSSEPQAWLFGTIHALPDGTSWRTARLDETIEAAGMLMVEIAALENEPRTRAIFTQLAGTPRQPDIGLKVPPAYRPRLFEMIRQLGYSPRDLSGTETWAVALLLAQLSETGDAANGADRAIIRDFLGREIAEFEGVEQQLGVFDQLPEREQRDLLVAVIDDLEKHRANPGKLRRAWLKGDVSAIAEAMEGGMLADPELRQALLVDRNKAWIEQLSPRIESGDRPLVAVGTAHLLGEDGLLELLRARGYTVTRIQ